jgi:hypothetical protein
MEIVWLEKKKEWFNGLATWKKIALGIFFFLFVVLATALYFVTKMSGLSRPEKPTKPKPVAHSNGYNEAQTIIDAEIGKVQEEIETIKEERKALDAVTKGAHEAVDAAKNPGEVMDAVRKSTFIFLFLLFLPLSAQGQKLPLYELPPGMSLEKDGVAYQCFNLEETQTLGHVYIEYRKYYALELKLDKLIGAADKLSTIYAVKDALNKPIVEGYQLRIQGLEAENVRILNASNKELWAWRTATGVSLVLAILGLFL